MTTAFNQVKFKNIAGIDQLVAVNGAGTEYQLTPPAGGSQALPEQWNQNNVAANQTNVALSALVSVNFDDIKMIRNGSIVGMRWRLTNAVTAGTLTVNPTKNGAAVTLAGVSTNASNQTGGASTQAAGVDVFVAGDAIGVQLTTDGAFAPTTDDLEVWLEISPT